MLLVPHAVEAIPNRRHPAGLQLGDPMWPCAVGVHGGAADNLWASRMRVTVSIQKFDSLSFQPFLVPADLHPHTLALKSEGVFTFVILTDKIVRLSAIQIFTGPVTSHVCELPPLKWSSLKYDFGGGLFDGEEAYG